MAGKPFIPGASQLPPTPTRIGTGRISRPFIPGQPSELNAEEELPLITEFLAEPAAEVPVAQTASVEEELPLITEFLADPTPYPTLTSEPQVVAVQQFEEPHLTPSALPEPATLQGLPAEEGAPVQPLHEVAVESPQAPPRVENPEVPDLQPLEETWIQEEWRKLDWKSVAAMGPNLGEDVEAAESAWAEGDWEGNKLARGRDPNQPEALASALENLAKKVRSGSLKVDNLGVETEEAALAAALAALLAKK